MADPVKAILSLETLSSEYSVFERDQVLTESQLNSVAGYFDDQERLARVELVGVGIAAGLRAAVATNKVVVGKGVAITTDGDLLIQSASTTYDSFKPYDENAPVYAPFYVSSGGGTGSSATMLKLYELVKEGESDVSKQPLTALPSSLGTNYAVLMYMESYQQDHDLCTATDCDNLGIVAMHTPRMLLISRTDATPLIGAIDTLSARARLLATVSADRPQITGTLATTAALAALYTTACNNTFTRMTTALPQLHQQVPILTQEVFGGDPQASWIVALNAIKAKFTSATSGIQYFYDFLKDLVDTWTALRETLLDIDGVLCPDLLAFPKHVLLGALSSANELRTGFYAAPISGNYRAQYDHAKFLIGKLNVLINTFSLPDAASRPTIKVTPGRSELVPLEERAIPYYYQIKSSLAPLTAWNWRRTLRGTQIDITAYRAAEWGGSTVAVNPLSSQIGCYDFFRIEGHYGQNIDTVMDKLEKDVADYNLPFDVRAVLLHGNTTPIKRKPKRYNDLHRMHKLVRSEVGSQLSGAKSFSEGYVTSVKSAKSNNLFDDSSGRSNKADAYNTQLSSSVSTVQNSFSAKNYSTFKSDTSWTAPYNTALTAASGFKTDFADISRTNITTALDTAITSNHRNWLDWLDVLITDKDQNEDEKLLFTTYLKNHHGLDHCAGVLRGGTFVLVYDDSANVIADFMLPYREVETADAEPVQEPVLTYTPPINLGSYLTMIKPIDWQFDDLRVGIREEWQKEIQIQTDYADFFQTSLGSLGDVLSKFNASTTTVTTVLPDLGDDYANGLLTDVNDFKNKITKTRDQLARQDLTDESKVKLTQQLDTYQRGLGAAAQELTQQMVQKGISTGAGQPGESAVRVVGSAIATVKDEATLKSIGTGMRDISANAGATGKNIVSGIGRVGGLVGF